ncbi:MAG: nuclear transport factor 2 family protein [Jatrophihabitans sp.]
MSDRDEIVDVLTEAAWIFDHREWDRLTEVFTPDVVAYGQEGLDAVRANTIRYLGRCGPTQHLVGNHRIRIDADTATSTSYVRAFHRSAAGRPEQFWDFVGEYHDSWRRTDAGWRMTARVCRPLATVGDLDLLAPS